MPTPLWFWIAFHIGVFIALAVDLVSFKLRDRDLSVAAAVRRSLIWVVLSLAFNAVVWHWRGADAGVDFFTSYLIEYSLSIDNIFVFVLIFGSFGVPQKAQHRVLVWGILGALVMRGTMIWLGVTLVNRFHWIIYVFGVFLLVTAIRMFFVSDTERDFSNTWLMRVSRKSPLVTNEFRDEHFTARVNGRFVITPLVLVLVMVDVMDLVFAVDSIPAVFAITTDTFIVYTSNICAILGLRSLYFLLAKLVDRFVYLKTGLAVVLAFVGLKMITSKFFEVPNLISLGVIVLILTVTIVASMAATPRGQRRAARK
ncbi:MAG: TerC family protein [Verrucomicrobiota bacterium]